MALEASPAEEGWTGELRSPKGALPFTLRSVGAELELSCDGRSYRFSRAAPVARLPWVGAFVEASAGFGAPEGSSAAAGAHLKLRPGKAGWVEGSLTLEGEEYVLSGAEVGEEVVALRGTLRDVHTGKELGWELSVLEEELLLTLRLEAADSAGAGTSFRGLRFVRAPAAR